MPATLEEIIPAFPVVEAGFGRPQRRQYAQSQLDRDIQELMSNKAMDIYTNDETLARTSTTSAMFSAERHYAKLREDQFKAQQLGSDECWASESLQFETLFTENSDDVLVEARSLLRNWVENKVNTADDVSSQINLKDTSLSTRELFLVPSRQREEIRDIVCQVISEKSVTTDKGAKPPFSNPSNPRLVMEARQKMVKERRLNLQDHKRALLEQEILERQKKLNEEKLSKQADLLVYKKQVEERWKSELAIRSAKLDLEAKKEEPLAVKRDKIEMIDESIEKERKALREKEENDRKVFIERRNAKVEELFKIKCLKNKRVHFSAWRELILMRIQVTSQLKVITRGGVSKSSKARTRSKPTSSEILRRETSIEMPYLLASLVPGRRQHEERAKKMTFFLQQLNVMPAMQEVGNMGQCIEDGEVGLPNLQSTTVLDDSAKESSPRATSESSDVKPSKQEKSKEKRNLRSAGDRKLIESMEKRDAERRERKMKLEQKRKEKQEMIEKAKQEEERLRLEEEEAQRKRILQEKLEEQRQLKEMEDRRRAERERLLALSKLAESRHQFSVQRIYGLKQERIKELKADTFAAKSVPRRYLRLWKAFVLSQKDKKWKEYRKQQLRNRVKELLEESPFEEALKYQLDLKGRYFRVEDLMVEAPATAH
ncbi:hypothetical protein HDU97_000811 [Phlyctochytrium planicorne]|nr:hypothetical protein HDU97_000811 [Phlyctochytrium planicorne]